MLKEITDANQHQDNQQCSVFMQSTIPTREPRVSLDRTVQFPKHLLPMRSSPSLNLQALCISTTDGPPPKPPPPNGAQTPLQRRAAPQHRLHWPARSELQLGLGSPTRVTTRSSKIGINGRDAPVNVMPHVTSTGMLKVALVGNGDPGQFLFALRIAEPRPVQVSLQLFRRPWFVSLFSLLQSLARSCSQECPNWAHVYVQQCKSAASTIMDILFPLSPRTTHVQLRCHPHSHVDGCTVRVMPRPRPSI